MEDVQKTRPRNWAGQVAGEPFLWRAVTAGAGRIPGDPEKPFTGPSVQVFPSLLSFEIPGNWTQKPRHHET